MWEFLKRRSDKPAAHGPAQTAKGADDGFVRFKRDNPGATYAQYYVSQVLRTIGDGKTHTTIGLRVRESEGGDGDESDFMEAGRGPFQKYRRLCGVRPDDRVVDYGCGSLRLGIHFMEYLKAGNYMGLDVTRDFMEIGISAMPELIADKKPRLYAIDPTALQEAADFGADIVISNAVSYHVHPDEKARYLGNLVAICSKPGARLFFDVKLADSAARFRSRGWAYPLDLYIETLKPLTLVKQHRVVAVKDYPDVPTMRSAMLEFRRD